MYMKKIILLMLIFSCICSALCSAPPPIDMNGQLLNFSSGILVSGMDKSVGAIYKCSNVATVSGTQIDAYVTIAAITGATLIAFDNDAPIGYFPPISTTAANPFSPEINITAPNGKVDFNFNFKDVNGNDLVLMNLSNNTIDIDGQGTPGVFQEFVEFGGFSSFTNANPTDLVIIQAAGSDKIRFTGSSIYNGLIFNDLGRVQVF